MSSVILRFGDRMEKVAWAPQGVSVDWELIAVLVPPGPITKSQWLDALADRVTDMAMNEQPNLTKWASRVLGHYVGNTDDPEEAGQFFVTGNWNLQEHLSLAMYEGDPFPCLASENVDARTAIENTDFVNWVELVRAFVSSSSLD